MGRFKTLLVFELVVIATYALSPVLFLNLQTAFLSSFLVIVASGYTHKKLVKSRVKEGIYEDSRDPFEKIDDPYELFEEKDEQNIDEADLKAIFKEEKKKIKPFGLKNLKTGARTSFSLFRLGAYLFLIFGFIALKNNGILNVSIYLPSLGVGIVAGYLFIKDDNG